MPIYEPGLKEIVENNCKELRLTFDTSLEKNIDGKDILFIAV
jgi:UDPglucose 6-dehydrogenase